MKIIRELPGSYSSKVELVEIDGKQYVLKTWDKEETENEKQFLKALKSHGLQSLDVYENNELKSDQILLEYVDGSPKLLETPEHMFEFGKVVRRMHGIKYPSCFKIDSSGEPQALNWNDFLRNLSKDAITRLRKVETDLEEELLIKIESYINSRLPIKDPTFSLLHADLHTGNLLVKKNGIVIYDKNPEIFSGHSIYDLTTLLTHYPNGTYVNTDDIKNQNDKLLMDSFIKGYGKDFLSEDRQIFDLYFIIKAIARYPSPWEVHVKEAIKRIVEK